MCGVVGEAQGVSDPGALEGQARLAAEEGQGADLAETQGMRAAVEQARGDQSVHIGRVYRAIADAARVRFHLDQRLQMEGAAGAVADDLDVSPGLLRRLGERRRHVICANSDGGGVAGNEDAYAHARTVAIRFSRRAPESLASGRSSTSAAGPLAHRPRQ